MNKTLYCGSLKPPCRPFIIGIGGSRSGAGKTTVAAALLKYFTASPGPLKLWGAIKYTKTDFCSSLIDDRNIIEQAGKDTGKLLSAGAEQVLWLKGPREGIEETTSVAIERLHHLDGIIIEGNSAIEFSNPDIVIFISAACGETEKPSSFRLIDHADIIVFRRDSMPPTAHDKVYSASSVYYDPEDKTTEQELFECMKAVIEERIIERIKQLLKQNAVNHRVSCPVARSIADELKVPYSEVGRAANELKIKIMNCELGCF